MAALTVLILFVMARCTSGCRGPGVTVTRRLKCSISGIFRRWNDSSMRLQWRPDRITGCFRINRILILLILFPLQVSAQRDVTRYVNPFIGTAGHGHTFPGAIVPFGMVQLSPDTRLTGWDGCSGYHYSDSIIYGFSHTHLSGTGISDYGDILLMPTVGEVYLKATDGGGTERGYASRFSHERETASPGYY